MTPGQHIALKDYTTSITDPTPAPVPLPAMPASVVNATQSTLKVTVPRGTKKGAQISVPLADSTELMVAPPPSGAPLFTANVGMQHTHCCLSMVAVKPGKDFFVTVYALTVEVPPGYLPGTVIDIVNPVTSKALQMVAPGGGEFHAARRGRESAEVTDSHISHSDCWRAVYDQ